MYTNVISSQILHPIASSAGQTRFFKTYSNNVHCFAFYSFLPPEAPPPPRSQQRRLSNLQDIEEVDEDVSSADSLASGDHTNFLYSDTRYSLEINHYSRMCSRQLLSS